MPPAPPTFSKTTVWPKSSERRDANRRPRTSAALPAANGYTMVTGRVGQSCAVAGVIAPTSAAKAGVILILRIWALLTCKLSVRLHPFYARPVLSSTLTLHQLSRAGKRGGMRVCQLLALTDVSR